MVIVLVINKTHSIVHGVFARCFDGVFGLFARSDPRWDPCILAPIRADPGTFSVAGVRIRANFGPRIRSHLPAGPPGALWPAGSWCSPHQTFVAWVGVQGDPQPRDEQSVFITENSQEFSGRTTPGAQARASIRQRPSSLVLKFTHEDKQMFSVQPMRCWGFLVRQRSVTSRGLEADHGPAPSSAPHGSDDELET